MSRPAVALLLISLSLLASVFSGCTLAGSAAKVAAGESSLRKGDWTAARRSFDQALRQRPKDAKLALLVAQEWMKYGRWLEALRVLERAAHAAPNADIYTQMGACYHNLNDIKRAEQAYLKALELNPRNPLALNNLGYLWADQGRNLPHAIRMLEEADRLAPNQAFIMDSLGWAYYKQAVVDARTGKARSARRLLEAARVFVEKAVDASPGQPEQHYHLGVIYAELGYLDQAKGELRRALAARSSLPQAHKALRELEARGEKPTEGKPGPKNNATHARTPTPLNPNSR